MKKKWERNDTQEWIMVKAREYIAPCYAKAKKLQFHYENNKENFNNKKLYEGKKGKSYTRNSKQAKNSIAFYVQRKLNILWTIQQKHYEQRVSFSEKF